MTLLGTFPNFSSDYSVFGQMLVNLTAAILGLVFTLGARFKEQYKDHRIYWSGFWIGSIGMFSYYSYTTYYNMPNGFLFKLVQAVVILIGNICLSVIAFCLLEMKLNRRRVVLISFVLLLIALIVNMVNPVGNSFLSIIHCSLFLIIGFNFRHISIESALTYTAYGLLTLSTLWGKVVNQSFHQAVPSVLILLQFGFIASIYKLCQVEERPAIKSKT